MGLSATIHLATALCLSMSAMAVTFAKSPIVETTSGTVRGYYPNASTRAFLGIPYAQPPVGSLRFKSPQPIEQKATEVIDATEFGLSCYQYRANVVGASALSPTTGESEDCLTLNIWGSDTSSGCLRPILVWMYGGAFTEGSSSVPMYNGQNLAEAHPDVMVVTINYRVNIFGFANSPAVPEKNVGLRDQRLALEWLRDNIAAFGGDPKRMVLGGESAGSMSTSIYAYAYPEDPIVNGFLMESGEAGIAFPDDGTLWTQLSEKLGCQSRNSQEELKCMQEVDGFTLKRTLSPEELNPLSSPPSTPPTIDNITYFGAEAYPMLGAAGKFARVPALRGINGNEGNALTPYTPEGLLDQTIADWVTEAFNCATRTEASWWAAHNVPSWRYRYLGEFPSLAIYNWMKAYHGAEIPLIFGTMDSTQVRDPEPYEIEAREYIQQAVVAFVKDPYQGLENFGWPLYSPNTTSLVELFKNNSPKASFAKPDLYDAAC